MRAEPARAPLGRLIRHWRSVRGLSQLALSERAEVSTRHLSCVENGRSAPSRELVLGLAAALDVPLRERNRWLLAAGFAPAYHERALDEPQMAEVRRVVDLVLARHDPFPALAVDRGWNLLRANAALARLLAAFGPFTAELGPRAGNAMHLLFHPGGLRPHVVNWREVAGHIVERLRREAEAEPGAARSLLDELSVYGPLPGIGTASELRLLLPVKLRRGELELSLVTTITSLGTAIDLTAQELRIETYFPTDAASERWLRDG